MKYKVTITETLERVVYVEASSPTEAHDIVTEGYKNEAYVLDDSDYKETIIIVEH